MESSASQQSSVKKDAIDEKLAKAVESDLEAMARFEESKRLREYRLRLREENSAEAVAQSRKEITQKKGQLKSDVKRTTAFVKKLRNLSEDNRSSLAKDARELNLKRYISEIVVAIAEAKFKTADVSAAVEICSLLHQRYSDFTDPLIQQLLTAFEQPAVTNTAEDKQLMSRKRVTVKFLAELFLCGIIIDTGVILRIVRYMCAPFQHSQPSAENNDNNFIPTQDVALLVSFARHAGEDLLGVVSRKQRVVMEAAATVSPSFEKPKLIDEDTQVELRQQLHDACVNVCSLLVREHKLLRKLEKRNAKDLLNKGELSEEAQARYENTKKGYERLLGGATSLTDALNVEMPDLPEEQPEPLQESGIGTISLWEGETRHDGPLDGPFEDEEAKAFYQDLPSLLDMVPSAVLGYSEAEVARMREKQLQEQQNGESTPAEDAAEDAEESSEPTAEEVEQLLPDLSVEDDKKKDDILATDSGETIADDSEKKHQLSFDLFEAKLENLVNKDRCDEAAVDFCYLNNKGTRKRLVRVLFMVPRNRLELIPHYARLAAALNTVLPDIGPSLIEMLMREFYGLQKAKAQNRLETRVRNIRFIGELTKFRLVPPNSAFRCLKKCLDDFVGHNIDVATTFLETCGRFLYRTSYTHTRCANLLEVMMRLKNAKNLDNRAEIMIQNAYYVCKPPERAGWKVKEHPIIYRFMMKLIYQDLEKENVDTILKTMRKLHWESPETTVHFLKCVLKVTKSRYMHLHLVCDLLAGLNKYQDHLGVMVVDAVVEAIRRGLEQNDYREQQLRVGYVKLFGELYNYSLVSSNLVIEMLHYIIDFGHDLLAYQKIQAEALGQPFRLDATNELMHRAYPPLRFDPRVPTSVDSPDDMFRIRLVCCMLETCGNYFDQGTPKEKLDRFLIYFQRYIFSKPYIPTDTEFAILDMLDALRPENSRNTIKRFQSWEEAQEALEKIQAVEIEEAVKVFNLDKAKLGSIPGGTDLSAHGYSEEDDNSDDEDDDGEEENDENDDEREEGEEDDGPEGDDEEDDGDQQDETERQDLDDEDVIFRDHRKTAEEDEDFEKEFRAMMQESLEGSRKITRMVNADNMALPMSYKGAARDAEDEQDSEAPEEGVKFRLLKRGTKGKIEAKTLFVPSHTSLAHHSQRQEDAEREEQSELKRLVLQYEAREVEGYEEQRNRFQGRGGYYRRGRR